MSASGGLGSLSRANRGGPSGVDEAALGLGHVRSARIRRRPLVPSWVLKVIMAITGVLFALFVLVHMIGNLKVFTGASPSTHTPTGCAPFYNRFCRTKDCCLLSAIAQKNPIAPMKNGIIPMMVGPSSPKLAAKGRVPVTTKTETKVIRGIQTLLT